MTKDQLKVFELLLLKKRDELLKEIGYFQDAVVNSAGNLPFHSSHMTDQGTATVEKENAFMIASKGLSLLYYIDEALRMIQNNTYGRCTECGGQIAPERLEAIPHARLCIKCKLAEGKKELEA